MSSFITDNLSYLYGEINNLQIKKEKVIAEIKRDYPCGWAPASRISERTRITYRINKIKLETNRLKASLK